ncbi:MAG: bifunctional oligoribonuclease/PAP phosphatase NrnA [Firmicutes bacterium]|nr:bifunctional oligoribonuclease/PAP phosphatase NrnA [Bacillota bacterium]
MYKEIYKTIKKFDTIVIARHVGPDPDALASQIALRDSIKLTFPDKKVLAVGNGSGKFSYLGKLDKLEDVHDALLIVTDTPDEKRIDCSMNLLDFEHIMKIDHHPYVDGYADIEFIDDEASSACEIIMDIILNTKLKCDKAIAEILYLGLVSDSNRFMFSSCTSKTFMIVSKFLEEYKFDISKLYEKLYLRPLCEVRLEGYISSNMTVTENGLGYIKITDDIIKEYGVDAASAGNMVNNFNFIDEVLVWATLTEDIKNDQIRISIRSRGPVINKLAEEYNGGGHKFASGVKLKTFDDAMKLINDLDELLVEYNKDKEEE